MVVSGLAHGHPEPVTECATCAGLAVTRGAATRLGDLAVWEWRGRFWRYDDAADDLVQVLDARAVAECDRLARALQ